MECIIDIRRKRGKRLHKCSLEYVVLIFKITYLNCKILCHSYACMYVWMYVCMYGRMYVRMHACSYVGIYVFMCKYKSTYICLCMYINKYIYIYIKNFKIVCVQTCMQAFMYVFLYLYMHVGTWQVCIYVLGCIYLFMHVCLFLCSYMSASSQSRKVGQRPTKKTIRKKRARPALLKTRSSRKW